MKVKKIIALLLVICMIICLTACGGKKAGDDKDTLTIAFGADRGTLDPMHLIGFDSMIAIRMIYEPLWDIDGEGNMHYVLATNLEYVEPTVWHVTIREGVKFSNGNPLTAEDVVNSLYLGNHRTGESDYLPELNLDKTKALDDKTVEIVFNSYDLSYVTTMISLPIIDKESYDETKIMTTPIGTGPYKLDEYVVNSHINLSRRDDYWGDKPAIKNLEFRVYSEQSQMTNAITTGEVDISKVPFQDIPFVQELKDYTVDLHETAQSTTMYFNTTENSFFYKNPDARKAVALAIDQQAIADIAYSGFAEPSVMPLSVGNIDTKESYKNIGVYGMGHDVEKAKELADKSGLTGQTVVLITDGSPDFILCAESIQSDLKEIGVTVDIHNYDSGSAADVYTDPTMYDMAMSFTYTPSETIAQNMYAWVLFANAGIYATSEWEGRDRYLELIDGIMAISDPAELDARYQELIEIHENAMIWYSLVDKQAALAYNSNLNGYAQNIMGNVNYDELSWK